MHDSSVLFCCVFIEDVEAVVHLKHAVLWQHIVSTENWQIDALCIDLLMV